MNFFEEHYPWPERITALGLHDGAGFRARYPGIEYVQGDACALPFGDGEFDIVFSNAVIEHVGGRERQRQLVSEAIRVGRRVFITTPNRRFPVEVHTRLPLVHWLPDAVAHPVYRALGQEPATELHLLTRRTLRGPLPRPGADRQPRPHAGGDRRLARASSSRSRPASWSSVSSCTTSRWPSSGSWACAGRRSTPSRRGRRRSFSPRCSSSPGTCAACRPFGRPTSSRRATRSSIVLYWLIPQDVLGGEATARGELLALRHHLLPGRRVRPRAPDRPRLAKSAAASAASSSCRPSSSPSSGCSISPSCRCRRGATRAFPAGSPSSSGSTTRDSPGSPRTGSTTRATRTTRSGGSCRRSSRRSRARTCSSWRSSTSSAARSAGGGASSRCSSSARSCTRTRAPRSRRSPSG